MIVRGKKARPRKTVGREPTPKPIAQSYTFPAPVRGLILDENIAAPQTSGALRLDNFVCTLTGIRPRGGSQKYASLGGAVSSMFTYKSGATRKFFGATEAHVYDITDVADAETAPTPDISGQSSGAYSTEQFGTVGGSYLYAVNGGDNAQLFDGTTWTEINASSSPSITGVLTSDFSHVWSFASRLFFVEKDTMSAWFLPVDSIAGAATEFSLSGIFRQGGTLLFGATWSLDAGDGLDDKCVFVSSEGEVAVYEGTNPNSASDWRKVGVYQISRPLGAQAVMQAGGDLIIGTEIGAIPLSQAINNDVAALTPLSVSSPITPLWQERARALPVDWEFMRWPQENILVVSQPHDADGALLVANLQTGAWSRFTGWHAICLGFHDGAGYYGNASGIYQMETTGADNGENYTCVYLGRFDPLGGAGVQKTVVQARAVTQTSRPINAQVSVLSDFDERISTAPNSVSDSDNDFQAGWGTAVWGQSVWGGLSKGVGDDQWSSIGRTGYVFAPELQMTFGVSDAPIAELAYIDVTFHQGALVA